MVVKVIVVLLAILWFCGVATLTYTYKNNGNLGIFSGAGNGKRHPPPPRNRGPNADHINVRSSNLNKP